MRKDQVIHGYRILQDFTTAGSGLSKWTFAEKGGQTYFLKEFLWPTYPVKGAPGSAEVKARKKEACKAFEARNKALMKAVNGTAPPGGNLVTTTELFRQGAKYYKATLKVDVASLTIPEVASLPINKQLLILLTVAHSLRVLHTADIVHGDLRPENILLKQTITGDYAAKLIDFDNSYFSGEPPIRQELVGDPIYFAPEVGRYVEAADGADPLQLTTCSDIFSLGLVYTQYLTGDFPSFSQTKYRYPYVAAGNGGRLTLRRNGFPPRMRQLLREMMAGNPEARPDIQEVFGRLKDPAILTAGQARAKSTKKKTEASTTEKGASTSSGSKVKGTLAGKAKPEAAATEESTPAAAEKTSAVDTTESMPASKLKGTLITRKDEG